MNFSQLHERLRIEMLRRIDRGILTSALLAHQTGFTPSHISNFLHRKRMLSLEALDKVLLAQRLSVADLFAESGLPSRGSSGLYYDSVPLVAQSTAVHDSHVSSTSTIDMVRVRSGLLDTLHERCSVRRRNWERFVAVRITEKQAEAMWPVLLPRAVLLIDRHYNSSLGYSAGVRTIYAVLDGNLLRFCYVELTRARLVLRPYNRTHPVAVIDLSPGQTASDLLVGRVFLTIADL